MTPDPSTAFIENVTGDRDTVPAAGSRKPDPSEPWRYVCPECGGYPNRECSQTAYRCSRCKQFWQESELRDKKGDTDA